MRCNLVALAHLLRANQFILAIPAQFEASIIFFIALVALETSIGEKVVCREVIAPTGRTPEVSAGQKAILLLSPTPARTLMRGSALGAPKSLKPGRQWLARVQNVTDRSGCPALTIADSERLDLMAHASRTPAQVRLLGPSALSPGQTAIVILLLNQALPFCRDYPIALARHGVLAAEGKLVGSK